MNPTERFRRRIDTSILDEEEAKITQKAHSTLLSLGKIDLPPQLNEFGDDELIKELTDRGYKVEKVGA